MVMPRHVLTTCILPDFSLVWIITVYDYYRQTGNIELFKTLWPKIQKVISYFENNRNASKYGLVKYDNRFLYFGDGTNIYRGHISTLLNMLYLCALRNLKEMLELAQIKNINIDNWISEIENAIREKLFDKEKGLFTEGLDQALSQVKRYSVHEQIMGLKLNLIPNASESILKKIVLPYISDKEIAGEIPTAFWSSFAFEVLLEMGYGKEVLQYIKRHWSPMLITGTTWEYFDWKPGSFRSVSHAWSAHPLFHLVKILTGIRSLAPNWKKIAISPVIPEKIKYAEARVPSPQGEIIAGWRKDKNKITVYGILPENIEAHISLESLHEIINEPGKFKFEITT